MQGIYSNKTNTKKRINKDGMYLFVLALPFVIAVFLFNYLPLAGWIYAFFDYKPGIPLNKVPFVGLEKFADMIVNSEDILRVLANTLALSFLSILASPLPVGLAILITEVKSSKFKKVVQTITTLPNFIGWVIIFSLSFAMFSSEGVLNQAFMNLGLIQEPVNILGDEKNVWLFQTLLLIWKTVGWNAIIYLAAISGIDSELYDAAKVDGAGRFRSILHVTIPGVAPTFIVLLLLSVGSLLNAGSGMEQYLVFYNPMVANKIEVLDLYVYRQGLVINDYSFATAVGMLKTIVSVMLLFIVNSISKRVREDSII
ncbi:MAG TPA: ABC transporter permease subunit [Ruminiclostridium sp.]